MTEIYLSTVLETGEFTIKVLADSVSDEGLLPGLWWEDRGALLSLFF